MLAVSFEANAGGVAVAFILLAIVWVLFRHRSGKVETRLGTIQIGVDQINAQVNHVEPTTPTVREDVIDVREAVMEGGTLHAMLCEVRVDVAEMRRDVKRVDRRVSSVETSQIGTNERLGEVGRLSRQTGDLLAQHLEERKQ